MQSQTELSTSVPKYLDTKHVSDFFTVVSPFQVKGDSLLKLSFDENKHCSYIQEKWQYAY